MYTIAGLLEGNRSLSQLRRAFAALGWEDVALELFDTGAIDRDEAVFHDALAAVERADFVLFEFHGSMAYFRKYLRFRDYFQGVKPYFFRSSIESEMEEMTAQCQLPRDVTARLNAYLEAGGEENRKNFLRLLRQSATGEDMAVGEIEIPKWDGVYGLPSGCSEEQYLEALGESDAPVIGVLAHFQTIQTGNTDHLDGLMAHIRHAGCLPLVLYSNMMPAPDGAWGGLREALRHYMLREGKSIPDAVIVTTGHALSVLSAPGCGMEQVTDSVFEILGVPTIHALHTNFTYQEWQESIRGMDAMFLGNVYTAEYDGQLISVPLTCTETVETPYGPVDRSVLIEDRAEKIVRLAKNWAKLRHTPNKDKKVAIILHNMPPRADMIGGAYGLDTPESVYQMCRALQAEGYWMEEEFTSGRDIIDRITQSLTNDSRFRSPEELLERAEVTIGPEVWRKWFDVLPEENRTELHRDWGDAPGEILAVGDQILVPGIRNGNVFIGLQPPRSFEEKAEECYHSTDIVCPWQYLAYYRYLEEEFGASAIVHVGTHGTIEWLPGKEIGLSGRCYPDLAIGTLPHFYPYIIDVPGEGAQAKRRTAACILDHLIPSMTEGGSYGDLTVLDDLIEDYYHARQNSDGKMELLAQRIQEISDRLHISDELHLTAEDFREDFQSAVEQLHLWVSELKCSEIKDGLHIFGCAPEGERLRNMLRLLVRVKNGHVPSLRQGLLAAEGLDVDELLDHPEACRDGVTNAMRLERADERGRHLFEAWETLHYSEEAIPGLLEDLCQKEHLPLERTGELRRCLVFTAREVLPRVESTTDEIASFVSGMAGEFVKKGPSGAPSRGNACILPTGRNFYTTDPTEIPTRASWETGIRLGRQLLETHLRETGEKPEQIAIVVYSGETIKTGGDDIAETLWLYGVRPVWLGSTDKVIGLEVIPVEELGRPRIDVTLRISGLFRDTFPNLIDLVDEAVNLVAALDETPEENYVKKHVDEDMAAFLREGQSPEQAAQRALLRIFGCPPGTYGAGVDIMVASKNWETSDDLGRAYIQWSGHGYSRTIHGEKLQDLFAHRLKTCDVTVKNISSCEEDMLDSDDFYNYHGGLISAVKAQRGQAPASYSTNAADVSHVVTKNVAQETARVMRARIQNPKWIEGLQKHGFRGAQEFAAMVDILFGWDATSDVVEDYMYDGVFDTYLGDEKLRDWIRQENPWALHAMAERLLEASQRDMWDADEEKLAQLRQIYLEMEGTLEGE